MTDIGPDPLTGQRRQVRRRYATLAEAMEAYTCIRVQALAGHYDARSRLTVEMVCVAWLADRRCRAGTLANYRNSLKPLVAAHGSLPIGSLSKRHIDALIEQLQTGGLTRADGARRRPWKARTVNLMLTVLSMVLEDARKQGMVTINVAELVDRARPIQVEIETFSEDEVRTVLVAARRERYELAWHLALCGLRRGEICGLRIEDIDLDAMTLTIRRSRVSVDGAVLVEPPKTAKGRRTLPLTASLADVLRCELRRLAAEQLLAGPAYRGDGHLITDELGRPLHPETLSDKWNTFLATAGARRIRLHDARHTCATLMHLQGVPAAVIAAWLGHANPAFTSRTYIHPRPETLHLAADALNTLIRG